MLLGRPLRVNDEVLAARRPNRPEERIVERVVVLYGQGRGFPATRSARSPARSQPLPARRHVTARDVIAVRRRHRR